MLDLFKGTPCGGMSRASIGMGMSRHLYVMEELQKIKESDPKRKIIFVDPEKEYKEVSHFKLKQLISEVYELNNKVIVLSMNKEYKQFSEQLKGLYTYSNVSKISNKNNLIVIEVKNNCIAETTNALNHCFELIKENYTQNICSSVFIDQINERFIFNKEYLSNLFLKARSLNSSICVFS